MHSGNAEHFIRFSTLLVPACNKILDTEQASNRAPGVAHLSMTQRIHPSDAHIARLKLNANSQGLGDEYFRTG